jgi:hypothetical protein
VLLRISFYGLYICYHLSHGEDVIHMNVMDRYIGTTDICILSLFLLTF